MSRCRCADIADCERKIATLRDASAEMKNYKVSLKAITDKFSDLISDIKVTYDVANMDEFISAMSELDSDLRTERKDFLAEIDSVITELESDLDDMASEDEDYHEEEDEDDELLLGGVGVVDNLK